MMKRICTHSRRIACCALVICLLTAFLLSLTAFASETEDPFGRVHDPNAPRIVDNLNLLSDSFESSLQSQISKMQSDLQTDFVLLTTNDLGDYMLDGNGAMRYAEDYYDQHGFGIGASFDGAILVIYRSPDDSFGLCGYAFTGKEVSRFAHENENIENTLYPLLRDKKYALAAQKFFDLFERKHHWYSRLSILKVLICVGIAVIIGLIYLGSLKKKMKTVVAAVSAKNYLVDGTYNLRSMNEIFVRSAISRTPRQTERSSGGGGSSHTGSSGVSHSGGGFRF